MSAERADRLAGRLGEKEVDALVVTDLVNVRYLTGFSGTNGLCIVGPELRAFFTDFRYTQRAEREVSGFDLDEEDRELLKGAIRRVEDAGVARLGFEDGDLSVRQHAKLAELLPEEVELVPTGDLVLELRAVKDAGELHAIRDAARAANATYDYLREVEFRGRGEREVALDLEQDMRRRGVEPAFPTIVAAGPNGALPHHEAGDERIEEGALVVVDLGCRVDGYCSDSTRTFASGAVDDSAHELHELVRETQAEALDAVRPGAECRAVDSVARDRLGAAGHGDRFGHGLGHGVGLEVHESPTLSQRSEGQLEEGNVVTVEPGVYLPGTHGVRIEDLVVVGAEGPEVLTTFPKSLVTLA